MSNGGSVSWAGVIARRKYLILLILLLALAVLYPSIRGRHVGQRTFDLLFSFTLLATIFAVSRHPRPFAVSLALAVPAVLLTWIVHVLALQAFGVVRPLLMFQIGFDFLFLTFTVSVILWDILRAGDIDSDKICGAICVYLLLGVIFALIFAAIELLQPGSFSPAVEEASAAAGPAAALDWPRFLYFSFVTLSTLGYGDVTPQLGAARTFSWVEAVFGQLYLAVLIAHLVGVRITHTRDQTRSGRA